MAGLGQAATSVTFTDFDSVLTGNGMLVGGSATDLTVSGVVEDVNNYRYTVSYSGASFDSDTTNDTLTFEILVQSWALGDIDLNEAGANAGGNITTSGTATIGINDATGDTGGNFSVNGGNMNANQSVQFTLQNFNVSTSDSSTLTASLNGFTQIQLNENGNSYGHQTVLGVGSDLTSNSWNAPSTWSFAAEKTGADTFYVSSADSTAPHSNRQRWDFTNLAFEVDVVPEPSSSAMLLGGLSILVLRRRRN